MFCSSGHECARLWYLGPRIWDCALISLLTSTPPSVCAADAPSQPGPIHQAKALVGSLLSSALSRVRAARKVIWHVEDLAVGGAKLALRVARRSVRPLLVGLVVHRALRTIEGSRLPEMRMARMSPAERLEYNNTRLMGADWREQMEQDFLDAAKEVQDGYNTGECFRTNECITGECFRTDQD